MSDRPLRLLYIHEVNWRRKVVFEIHDFPELLSLRGHEVVFIDFPEDEPRTGWRRFLDLKTDTEKGLSRAHDGSSVEVRTPGRVFPPPLDRLVASITHIPEIWRTLRDGVFDAVVLYGVPTNGWQTVRIARRFNVPVMFRSIDVSHELRRTPFGWLIRQAERSILKRADWVSTHNVALRDYCVDRGADPNRISVDPPGLDFERFAFDAGDDAARARLGFAPEDRVVVFMGTLFRFSGLESFIRGMAPALRMRSDLKLLIVGGGEAERQLAQLVADVGLEASVTFTGFVDYESLPSHLHAADIAVNTLRPSKVSHCALPGKVLQYVGSGLPTVSTPLRGLMGLLQEGDGVVYREPGDEFVEAVLELVDDPDAARTLGERGRKTLLRHGSWADSVTTLERRLSDLAASPSR